MSQFSRSLRSSVAVAIMLCASQAAAETEYTTWVVAEGQTCTSIAEAFYGDARKYNLIHAHNDLGPSPHVLVAGMELRLPLLADARLEQKRGPVQARAPEASWRRAPVGLDLYRAWRLNTLDHARALVGFRDDSELLLRENTLVVIYGPAAKRAERQRGRAELTSGALKSRLDELSGKSTLTVETPGAVAELGAGSALVTVDEKATTRVSNHEGDATKFSSKSQPKAPVDVGAGFGSLVKKGSAPTPPRPLPPSPRWEAGPRSFATLGTTTVTASWTPETLAAGYFVELTADAAGVQIVQAAYTPSNVKSLEVQGLPPGRYWATVSSIDGDNFESIPSARLELAVVPIEPPAGTRIDGDTPRFYSGTELEAPGGFRCRSNPDSPFAERFSLRAPNAPVVSGPSYPGWVESVVVECEDSFGAMREDVEVAIPAFQLESDALSDGHWLMEAGAPSVVSIVFDRGWFQTSARFENGEVPTAHTGASTSRLLLAPTTNGEQTLTIAAGDQPLVEVPVSVTTPVATDIPVHLGGGFVVAQTPAGWFDEELSTMFGARAFARLPLGSWFSVSSLLDGVGSSDGFGLALGVEASAAIPWTVRPYLAAGARAWVTGDAGMRATLDPSVGLDLPFGNIGFDLRFTPSLADERGEPGLYPGGAALFYGSF